MWAGSKRAEVSVRAIRMSRSCYLVLSCIGLPVSPMYTLPHSQGIHTHWSVEILHLVTNGEMICFPDPFHARWHPFLHRKDFPLEISLPASFVSFHVRFTLYQTVSAVKFILYSSRSTKRSTLCGGLQCKNHATITINPRVYKIFNPLASS